MTLALGAITQHRAISPTQSPPAVLNEGSCMMM
jgi:hypothetical protein